jgi:hypothetical protein
MGRSFVDSGVDRWSVSVPTGREKCERREPTFESLERPRGVRGRPCRCHSVERAFL